MSIACVGLSMSLVARAAGAVALITGLATTAVSAQSFTGLGFFTEPPVAGTESYARGVSNNGVVTGYGYIPPGNAPTTGFRAFGWTAGGGMANLGTLPGGIVSAGRTVSDDGSAAVGFSDSSMGVRACLWNNAGPQDLGVLPGYAYSHAYDVSADGSVVVGRNGSNTTFFRAFRKTGGVMTDLGVPSGGGWVSSVAYGVSGNGLVVVGAANKVQEDNDRAFRWSGGVMTSLGTLKQGSFSEAWATNTNGSVVVGTSDSSNGSRAFRWTGNKMTDLGTLPGQPYSYGREVSGDGLKIVGYCSDGSQETISSGSLLTTGRAFLYSGIPGSGGAMVDLNTYLPTLGLNLTGWTLREARGISSDGSTIVGWGWHNGAPEAWIARLIP